MKSVRISSLKGTKNIFVSFSRASDLLKEWGNMRRLYNMVLTKNMLKVITRHKDSFMKDKKFKLDWSRIEASRDLHELDSEFTL